MIMIKPANPQPYFPFHAAAWLQGESVIIFNRAQNGIYINLLAYAWASNSCSIPKNKAVLSKVTGGDGGEDADLDFVLKTAWIENHEDAGRLINARLWREWEKCVAISHRNAKAGKLGGLSKKETQRDSIQSAPVPAPYPEATTPTGRHAAPQQPVPANCPTCVMPMFSSEDRKGEAFSKCQNRACVHKGIMWRASGDGFHPKTGKEFEIVDGKVVEAAEKSTKPKREYAVVDGK